MFGYIHKIIILRNFKLIQKFDNMLCSCSRLFKTFALLAGNGLPKFIVKFCLWFQQILPTCRTLLFIQNQKWHLLAKSSHIKPTTLAPLRLVGSGGGGGEEGVTMHNNILAA